MRNTMYHLYNKYRSETPKGNFKEKLTSEQLILRHALDISVVFPLFNKLPHRYKLNFSKRILSFLSQYGFYEKGNVQLTNADKVKIAASYIKLTLGYSHYLINSFHSIIVYPTAQYFDEFKETHVGHFHPKMKTIMLALDEFTNGIHNSTDGKDVALHEFSHALCFEMLNPKTRHPSSDHFTLYYKKITNFVEVHQSQLIADQFLRMYGFSNKLELISVLVELFFECTEEFKLRYYMLYTYTGQLLMHPSVKT